MKKTLTLVVLAVMVGGLAVVGVREWGGMATGGMATGGAGSLRVEEGGAFAEGSGGAGGTHGGHLPSKAGPRDDDVVDVVEVMQTCLKEGALGEFRFEDIIEWKACPSEEIDGDRYRVGEVVYAAETIFGSKNVQAKAYIKDDKVVRWVYSKTGLEIR